MSIPPYITIQIHQQSAVIIIDTESIKYIFDLRTNQYTTSTNGIPSPMKPNQRQDALKRTREYLNTTPNIPDQNIIEHYLNQIEQITDETLQQIISKHEYQKTMKKIAREAQNIELIFPEKK